MSFEDNIKASVVDIRIDYPKAEDNFFIDTNVWVWFTSPNLSLIETYQNKEYPNYVAKLLKAKSNIFRCELILAELSHVVEKSLSELYEAYNIEDEEEQTFFNLKKYRHDFPEEREKTISEIDISWKTITDISKTFKVVVDENTSELIIEGLKNYYLDGYDMIYLEDIKNNINTPLILTDDRDFATVPDLTVFTANDKIIKAAEKKGLLVTR